MSTFACCEESQRPRSSAESRTSSAAPICRIWTSGTIRESWFEGPSELNTGGNVMKSPPFLVVAAIATRNNANLLAEYADDSVNGAGRAITVLKVAKTAGEVAEVGLAVTGVTGVDPRHGQDRRKRRCAGRRRRRGRRTHDRQTLRTRCRDHGGSEQGQMGSRTEGQRRRKRDKTGPKFGQRNRFSKVVISRAAV